MGQRHAGGQMSGAGIRCLSALQRLGPRSSRPRVQARHPTWRSNLRGPHAYERFGKPTGCRLIRRLPSSRRRGRARSVGVDAVDRQRRGGASACDEPGAETEEGGSRTHAQQRGSDSAEDGAEDSDQQSAGLRRLAVGRDRTRDPARHNSQDHPSREAHCACTFDDAGHETSVHSQDQVAPHDRRCGHLGPYGVRPISPPTRTPSDDGSGRPMRRIAEPFPGVQMGVRTHFRKACDRGH